MFLLKLPLLRHHSLMRRRQVGEMDFTKCTMAGVVAAESIVEVAAVDSAAIEVEEKVVAAVDASEDVAVETGRATEMPEKPTNALQLPRVYHYVHGPWCAKDYIAEPRGQQVSSDFYGLV